jgi:hypothetical protein
MVEMVDHREIQTLFHIIFGKRRRLCGRKTLLSGNVVTNLGRATLDHRGLLKSGQNGDAKENILRARACRGCQARWTG